MQTRPYSAASLFLGVLCSTVFLWLEGPALNQSARSFFWLGLPGALGLTLLAALLCAAAQDGSRLLAAILLLWFGAELIRTVAQAQSLCRSQFASGALLGALPLLLWLSLRSGGEAYVGVTRVLWWCFLLGGVVCMVGLGSQLRWQRLDFGPVQGPVPPQLIYPEYFAPALLLSRREQKKSLAQPLLCFAAQVLLMILSELLFGSAQGYNGYEALRAWGLGGFSRLDALLLLLWLAAALTRICLLFSAQRLLWKLLCSDRVDLTKGD